MKKLSNKKIRFTIALFLILSLFMGLSFFVVAQSPVIGYPFNGSYRTTTTASHSSANASGGFTATYIKGAAITSPTCTITVTAVNNLGAGVASGSASGTLSCSKVVPYLGAYGCICGSNFCSAYYWTATDY